MICSSGGTIVIATGNVFPRLNVKKSSGIYENRIQSHHRRSSMSVDAIPIRSKSSPRKRNIGCGVSSSPTTVVDEEVAVRRALAMRRVLEDNGDDGSSVRDFSLFTTKRGDTLFTQSWTPTGSVKNRSLLVQISFLYYLFCLFWRHVLHSLMDPLCLETCGSRAFELN